MFIRYRVKGICFTTLLLLSCSSKVKNCCCIPAKAVLFIMFYRYTKDLFLLVKRGDGRQVTGDRRRVSGVGCRLLSQSHVIGISSAVTSSRDSSFCGAAFCGAVTCSGFPD